MDTRKNNPFSLAVAENDYFNDKQEKIQVVSCKPEGSNCQSILTLINHNFQQSSYYYRNKDYRRAIEELESAFQGTIAIQRNTCSKCVSFFRTTIIETLTGYQIELKSKATGIFKKKRFLQDYELAERVLCSFREMQSEKKETKVIKMRNTEGLNSGVFGNVSLGT